MGKTSTAKKAPRLPRLNPPGPCWYVLQVGPMRALPTERGRLSPDAWTALLERLRGIETRIRAAGYEVFCPRERRRVRHARRVETVLRPYYPGYVFVRFDPRAEGWQEIGCLPGARGIIVNPAGIPIQMPAGLVERMIRAADADGVMPAPKGKRGAAVPLFERGQKVCASDGPFAGFPGVVDELRPQDRFAVIMEIFGRATVIEIDGADLRPVS